MKPIYILLLVLSGIVLASCNINNANLSSMEEVLLFDDSDNRQSIFEYGKTVETPEDNLINLFNNFPVLVKNDSLSLLSYEYLGTVESEKQLKSYLRYNLGNKVLRWGTHSSLEERDGSKTLEIRLREVSKVNIPFSQRKKMIDVLMERYVGVGFYAYAVNYRYGTEQYTYYIFIDPDTCKVVDKLNIFAFSWPLNSNPPLIDEYLYNLAGIPDSLATESQKALKKALYDVFYEKIRVENGIMILDCDESYFVSRGIPKEYYKDVKKSLDDNNAFFKKMKESGEKYWEDFSVEKLWQDWKDEYKTLKNNQI